MAGINVGFDGQYNCNVNLKNRVRTLIYCRVVDNQTTKLTGQLYLRKMIC